MDWQRTLLIAALAVVSYMMILQWQKDYVEAPQLEQVESYAQSYPQDLAEDVPTEDMASAADVPQDPSVAADTPALETLKPTQGLIRVETDVLSVKINPVGGDIVAVGLKDYPASLATPNVPFTLLESSNEHTYISQSGLIGPDGPDSNPGGRPQYASDQTSYTLSGKELVVTLRYQQDNGALISKVFTFTAGSHVVNVDHRVENHGTETWQGLMYGQIKRDGSADPGLNSMVGFGLPTYLGGAYWDQEKTYNKISFDDMVEAPLNKKIPGGWLAMIQHYFMSAWIPDQDQTHHYSTRVAKGNHIIGFTTPKISVAPEQSHTFSARFYAGPKIQKDLKALLPGKGMDLAIDFGPLFFISEILFWCLDTFHSWTGNWGFAIILLTMLVKVVFFYPSALSYKSMAKMRKVAPEMTRLREQYGDDRQKLSQEMMNLYKKEKINPLGGCLPILIQMPVFLALYWALLESVELRQAPFLFWIQDLAVMDPYFVLPLIMGGSMWVQQMLNPAPPDPMQAKVMKMMPILFTVMFLWFPAGLVLYWVTNNILSITQQYVITKRIESGASS
ncbi:membrane protein insertase YidC [Ketobacter sp.]|uniref:membrane protein insertase YidC n=1 Tax=Ketobacter sp. TaxID=2083498 RepID=UPI000F13CF80|nr:membrane protein insertase YidC [Ketobacter sp.]RLT96041.1 MAG: membrane protein insertase YidC [Ketobacter sp.]